jgi:phosphatidylglycerol:prolipoprotein diacylglycerol transferase
MILGYHTIFDIAAFFLANVAYGVWKRGSREHAPRLGQQLAIVIGSYAVGILFAKAAVQLEAGVPDSLSLFFDGLAGDGKSIVGGLLGGVLGVKLVKCFLAKPDAVVGRLSFGDRMVLPVAIGIAVARIGCFLSGLEDDTFGTPTSLPIGRDFGDGIPRHPAQLYEIGGIVIITGLILRFWDRARSPGDRFGWFLFGYFTLRFFLELVRCHPAPYMGLTVYQVLSAVGAVWALIGRF